MPGPPSAVQSLADQFARQDPLVLVAAAVAPFLMGGSDGGSSARGAIRSVLVMRGGFAKSVPIARYRRGTASDNRGWLGAAARVGARVRGGSCCLGGVH